MDLLTANDRPGEYPRSWYADTAHPLPPFAPAEGALSCDVCVVGGGFTGLSAALHLAERGYDVILLEAQRVGFGASGRNGGQVGTGQRLDQDALEGMVGQTAARALWDLSLDSVALTRDLAARHAPDAGYAEGILHAAHKPRYVSEMHAYAEKMARDYGYDRIQPLDRAAMRQMVGSTVYHGGDLDMSHIFTGVEETPEFVDGLHRSGKIVRRTASGAEAGTRRFEELEAETYARALEEAGGNVSAAARALGLSRATLDYRLNKHAITPARRAKPR